MGKTIEQVDEVVIRFAGDSGDGMQLLVVDSLNLLRLLEMI